MACFCPVMYQHVNISLSHAVIRDESQDIRYEIVHRGIAGATL